MALRMASKTGIKLVSLYLALIFFACLFLVMTEETNAFAYLYLIILTSPWSQGLGVLSLFSEDIGQMTKMSKVIFFTVLIILNSILIYVFGAKYEASKNRKVKIPAEKNKMSEKQSD